MKLKISNLKNPSVPAYIHIALLFHKIVFCPAFWCIFAVFASTAWTVDYSSCFGIIQSKIQLNIKLTKIWWSVRPKSSLEIGRNAIKPPKNVDRYNFWICTRIQFGIWVEECEQFKSHQIESLIIENIICNQTYYLQSFSISI